MKNILFISAIVIVLLPSCKKGKFDPLLSLKARNSRLIGTWVLTEFQSTTVKFIENEKITESLDEYYFDGEYLTVSKKTNFYGDIIDTIYTNKFDLSLTFNKDYSYDLSNSLPTALTTYNPVWKWRDTDKSKTVLLLSFSSFIVDRLSKNELILSNKTSSANNYENSTFFKRTYQSQLIFKKQ